MGGGPKWIEFGRFALSFVLRALSAYVDYFKMPTVDFNKNRDCIRLYQPPPTKRIQSSTAAQKDVFEV